jgi:hypothetical protein
MTAPSQYQDLLDDEIFKRGEVSGRLGTAITILTDMLIDLNALEIYYEKPSSKSVSPAVLDDLRRKVVEAKDVLHTALVHPG